MYGECLPPMAVRSGVYYALRQAGMIAQTPFWSWSLNVDLYVEGRDVWLQ